MIQIFPFYCVASECLKAKREPRRMEAYYFLMKAFSYMKNLLNIIFLVWRHAVIAVITLNIQPRSLSFRLS